jgi:hypothetical protein
MAAEPTGSERFACARKNSSMIRKFMFAGCLLFVVGCDKGMHVDDDLLPTKRRVAGVEATDNFQLPDVAYWVEAGGGYFDDHGVRDPNAPNMLLSQWSPNAPEEEPLLPATAKALQDDAAPAIDLHDVRLTPELRSQLSNLQHLQWLNVSLGVNGSDLGWLGGIAGLRGLTLTHANLENADFEGLKKAKSLQFLNLSNSTFTESDFMSFPRLEKLETLILSGKHISDECLVQIAKLRLPMLRSLCVEFGSITDTGMRSLCSNQLLRSDNLCVMPRIRKLE